MVRFAGLHMAVEARQVAAWLDMDVDHVWRRCKRLVELGLLEHHRVLHGRPGVYTATAAGLARTDLELPPARIVLGQYEHALELVWLFIELEHEFGYGRVLSERQLRSLEFRAAAIAPGGRRRYVPRYAVRLSSTDSGLHFPDLVVEWGAPKGGPLSIELELTSKGQARRRRIVRGYRNALHVERVRYYAAPAAGRLLARAVREEGASQVFDVRSWAVRRAPPNVGRFRC